MAKRRNAQKQLEEVTVEPVVEEVSTSADVARADDVKPSWQCRSCGDDQFEVFSELPKQEYHGFLEDGKKYTHIVRKRVRCVGCSQMTIQIAHDFDASLWVE